MCGICGFVGSGVLQQGCSDLVNMGKSILHSGPDEWMYYNYDPVSDPSALALMLIAGHARSQGMKVMLSGEGGDELFGGYRSYLRYNWLKYLNFMSPIFKRSFLLKSNIKRYDYRLADYLDIAKYNVFLGTAHISDRITRRLLLVDVDSVDVFISLNEKYSHNQRLRSAMLIDQTTRLPLIC